MVTAFLVPVVTVLFIARAMCRTIAAVSMIVVLLGAAVYAALWYHSGRAPSTDEMVLPVATLLGSFALDASFGWLIAVVGRIGRVPVSNGTTTRPRRTSRLHITMRPRRDWPQLP